jgi:DNA-binding HxlR family transcriptional regulator
MSKPAQRKVTSTNYRNEAELIAGCPLAAAMKLLGGRWKPMLLWYVHHDIRRFGGLRRTIVGVSEKMLYQQLRELERDGLLVRSIAGPRVVEYALTPLGASLVPHLRALAAWSEENGVARRLLGERPARSA